MASAKDISVRGDFYGRAPEKTKRVHVVRNSESSRNLFLFGFLETQLEEAGYVLADSLKDCDVALQLNIRKPVTETGRKGVTATFVSISLSGIERRSLEQGQEAWDFEIVASSMTYKETYFLLESCLACVPDLLDSKEGVTFEREFSKREIKRLVLASQEG